MGIRKEQMNGDEIQAVYILFFFFYTIAFDHDYVCGLVRDE